MNQKKNQDLDEMSVIDKNFTILCEPSNFGNKSIVAMILSAPGNVEKRQKTRSQLRSLQTKIDWVFVIGGTSANITKESQQYQDLMQISIEDKYENLAYKTLATFLWLHRLQHRSLPRKTLGMVL